MQKPWVCIDCGGRQDDAGTCLACGHEDVLDARKEDTRQLMHDVDRRLADRREDRLRFLGVGLGMATIFLLWLVPGYWSVRGTVYPGLPFLFDQWIFMALIGFAILKLGKRVFKTSRFPYLNSDLTMS
jgi:hypothetical protein